MNELSAIELYIDPPTHHFLGDRLFDDDTSRLNGDRQNAPYAHVREVLSAAGVPVRTADYLRDRTDDTLKIYVSLGMLDRFERLHRRPDVVLSAFFAMECPIVEPSLYRTLPRVARRFRRVFSWTTSEALRRFTHANLELHRFHWPQSFADVHANVWRQTERKFLVMINANKLPRLYWQELYTERMRAVEFFSRSGEIDLYGKGWDQPSMRVGVTGVPWTIKRPYLAAQRKWAQLRPDPLLVAARRVYKGRAMAKAEVLGQYKFALCFENCILKGWITEKMFDCFFAGTVPVYLGAPEIAEIVPPESFIDMRQFPDYAELRRFLRSLGADEIDRYRESARDYLHSAAYRDFTCATFARHFSRMVSEDARERAPVGLPARTGH